MQPVGLSRPRALLSCSVTDQQRAQQRTPFTHLRQPRSARSSHRTRRPRDRTLLLAAEELGPGSGSGGATRRPRRWPRPRARRLPPGKAGRREAGGGAEPSAPRRAASGPAAAGGSRTGGWAPRGTGPDSPKGEFPPPPLCQAACDGVKTCLSRDLFRLTSLGLKPILRNHLNLNDN